MTLDGMNCRNLDKNSYATAIANATTGQATLTSKDARPARTVIKRPGVRRSRYPARSRTARSRTSKRRTKRAGRKAARFAVYELRFTLYGIR